MANITLASIRDFFKKNQDIILPALCIFGYGLAIGLALNECARCGSSQGTTIQINRSNVNVDDLIISGANSPILVLDD